MSRQALPPWLLALPLLLSACQTPPKQTVLDLDTTDPRWISSECVAARKAAHDYNDKGLMRSAAGVAGTVAAGPVAGAVATTALSASQDDEREDLNVKVKRACVSGPGERSAGTIAATAPPPLAIPPAPPADASGAAKPASTTEPAGPQD